MKLFRVMTISLLLVSHAVASQSARGRIEGIVLQAGSVNPQPVVGARITVTKVNASTGASFLVPGRTAGTSITTGPTTPFPGLPAPGQRGTPPPPPGAPTLQQMALPIPPVTTGRDGRFVAPDLEEGSYRVLVTQDGYVRQEYGQRVFPGQGTLITLGAGQVFRDMTIRLIETGNLGGRIFDNSGRPAVGVPLQLLKAIYNQTGQRIFQNAGTARTNDRGEYRFFWVTPGRYYLGGGNAAANYSFGGANTSPNEPGDTFTLTFYPGVTDIGRATAIDVKSGSEAVFDFAVPRQQLFSISGKIVNPSPAAADGNVPAATISLAFQTLTGSTGVFQMQQAYDPATGLFVLRDVLPGAYILQAAAPPFSARVPVEITNSNVENLAVVIDGGVNINGRFIVDGGEMPPANTMQIQMRLVSNGLQNYSGSSATSQAVAADGSFSIPGVLPGEYRIVVPPSQDFYVKEIRYDRRDALNGPVPVCCTDAGTIEVIINRSVGQLDGVIVDDRSQPVAGVQAVLIPDARNRTELYKTATTDQTGNFVMRGVTPGDYKLFAWEALENFGYFDPDQMRRSESSGKAVRVAESSKLVVEGKIIPAER